MSCRCWEKCRNDGGDDSLVSSVTVSQGRMSWDQYSATQLMTRQISDLLTENDNIAQQFYHAIYNSIWPSGARWSCESWSSLPHTDNKSVLVLSKSESELQ